MGDPRGLLHVRDRRLPMSGGTLCVTGHRPNKLGGFDYRITNRLYHVALEALMEHWPAEVITGMALGWDQAIAEAALTLKIPFIAAIPFEGQERLWPPAAQDRFRSLRLKAASEVIVSLGGYEVAKMHTRNEWMVDRSVGVIALWDGSSGGTGGCVQYAKLTGKPVFNVWDKWVGRH